jgi:hypothetical protein
VSPHVDGRSLDQHRLDDNLELLTPLCSRAATGVEYLADERRTRSDKRADQSGRGRKPSSDIDSATLSDCADIWRGTGRHCQDGRRMAAASYRRKGRPLIVRRDQE